MVIYMNTKLEPANIVGGKKANGHKANCVCPICVNMKHQKTSKKNRRVTRHGGRMPEPEPELVGDKRDDSVINEVPDVVVPQERAQQARL